MGGSRWASNSIFLLRLVHDGGHNPKLVGGETITRIKKKEERGNPPIGKEGVPVPTPKQRAGGDGKSKRLKKRRDLRKRLTPP